MSKLLKVTRTETFVRIRRELKIDDGSRTIDETSHEAPLKKFDTAMQALTDVVANILELGQGYKKGMVIDSVSISHTKAGTRSASIDFSKHIDAVEHDHPMSTVMFQIDDAPKGEEGRCQCSKKHAELVAEFLERAEDYANGKRQQQMLNFNSKKAEAEAEDKTGTTPLPLDGEPGA